MKKTILIFLIGIAGFNFANAQTDSASAAMGELPNKAKGGATKFLLAGKAAMSWTNTQVEGTPSSHTFFPDALMLMPLVKVNNHLFLDAQVEVDANGIGGGAAINLVEMIAYYRLCPQASVFFGNFSPKYGLYLGVLDDFTNRYLTDPIGMGRGPQTQTGLGIQGGLQTGYSKMNYQLYISNGPQHTIDTTTMGTSNLTGQLNYDNYLDNNNNKAIGGSIGWLPFSNSSLQVDVSGQYTGKTGPDNSPLDSIYPHSSTSLAFDLNYYHVFDPIMVRVLAEYNSTTTKNYDYPFSVTDTTGTKSLIIPKFDNVLSGWFAGATIRASGSQSKFMSNLELGARVGSYTPPKYSDASLTDAPWGENAKTQTTICLTYWFTWKTPLNFAYDMLKETNRPTIKSYTARLIYFF